MFFEWYETWGIFYSSGTSVSLVGLATTSEHHLSRRGGNKWALIIWCPDLFFLYKLHVLYQSGTSRVLNFILPKSKRKTFEHCCRVPERGSWYSCSRTKRWKMCFLWVALTSIQHLKYIYVISLNFVPILMQKMFIYSLYTKISENYANNQSHIPIVLAYIAQHLLTHMFEILLIFMSWL